MNCGAPQWELVKEVLHKTIRRRSDEPKLKIGESVEIKKGVIGVVLARYTPSGDRDQVCYIVEIIFDESEKEAPRAK